MVDEKEKQATKVQTTESTTSGNIIQYGGGVVGGAFLGGYLGSLVGPVGTVVGSLVGAAGGIFVAASGGDSPKPENPLPTE